MSGSTNPTVKLSLRRKLRQSFSSRSSASTKPPTTPKTTASSQNSLTSNAGTRTSSWQSQQSQPIPSPITGQRLLASAAKRLTTQEYETLQQYTSLKWADIHHAIDQAIVAAIDKQRACLSKRWSYTIAGRHVVLRDEADKVVHWLDRFKSIGDVAANIDPLHIGLPWAGVRLLLEVAVTETNQMAALLVGCETSLFMASRLKIYTDFVHQLPTSLPQSNLEESISLACTHLLRFLARAIQTYQISSARRAFSAMWQTDEIIDFEKRGHDLLDRIERDASNCDRTVIIAQDRQALARIQQNMQLALSELHRIRQLQTSLDRLHLKIDLDKIPSAKRAVFNSIDGGHLLCHPATRLNLLDQVQRWAQQSDGKLIFWLHGPAGVGKSTISYTIAQWLDDQTQIRNVDLGASFFFKRGDGDRGSAARFFPTIVRQLVLKIPGLDLLLAKAVEQDPLVFDKALGEQFRRLLLEPLKSMTLAGVDEPSLVVIVDALDECENDNDIETLLQLWSELCCTSKIRIRLLLTSRPDLPIRLRFRQMSADLFENIDLQNAVPSNTIEQDIRTYLRDAFATIREQAQLRAPLGPALSNDWPGDEVLKSLADISVPLFIVAATLCRFVGDLEFDPSERLNEVLSYRSTGQMAPLEVTYLPVLKHLTTPTRTVADRTKLCEDFRFIVGSIICLIEPLSIVDLATLLNKPAASIARRLDPLHAVLLVPDDPLMPVRTFHLSFAEFLLSNTNEPFGIEARSTHLTLARHCLQLLSGSDGLRENMCELDSPARPRRDVDPDLIESRLPTALQYACRHWVFHIQHSGIHVMDDDEVHTFLQRHFLHWLETLSLMDRIADAVRFLEVLKSCVSVTASVQLSSFLEDARRFTLTNRRLADLTPLQLYSSATVFAPLNSPVRRCCGNIPKWIQQLPTTPATWGLQIQTLIGHTDWVWAIALSADGGLLASVSDDHTVRLWNLSTGQETQKLEGHTAGVSSVSFSHDSSLMASGSTDKTIRIWRPSTGQEVQRIQGLTQVHCVAFSPRDLLLASASSEATIRLWNPLTGQEVRSLRGHTAGVHSVVFSSDGLVMASAAEDGTVRVWRPSTGQELQRFEGHSTTFGRVAISADATLLASVSDHNTVRVWDMATARLLHQLDGQGYSILSLTFSSHSSILAVGSSDWTVRLWDLSTGAAIDRLRGHTGPVTALIFSHDSSQLVTASADRSVQLWSVPTSQNSLRPSKDYTNEGKTRFSYNGSLLATILIDGTSSLWDPSTGLEIQKLQKLGEDLGPCCDIQFSNDDSLLAAGFHDGIICVWSPSTGQEVWRLEGHTGLVLELAFSHHGQTLASVSLDGTARLWSLTDGQELQKLEMYGDYPTAVSFSHDDALLATTSAPNHKPVVVRLWQTATGQVVRRFEMDEPVDWIRGAAISSDFSLLALMSELPQENFCTIQLRNVSTGEVIKSVVVDGYIDKLSFTLNDNGLLSNRGVINIGNASFSESRLESWSCPTLVCKHDWVMYKGKKLLWLPNEYRLVVALHKDTIAFVPIAGQATFMKIDRSSLPRSVRPGEI